METFRELINRHKNKKLPPHNYYQMSSIQHPTKVKITSKKPPPVPNIIPIKSVTPKEHKKRKLFKNNFIQMLYQMDNISKKRRKSSSLTKTSLINPIYSSTNHYQKNNDNNNSNSFISNNNSLNHFHNYSTINLPQNKFKLDTTYNTLSKGRDQSIINQSTYSVNNFNSNNLPFSLNISNDSILWNKLKNKNNTPLSVRNGHSEVPSKENISILEGIGNSNVNSIGNVIRTLNVSSMMKNTSQDENKNEKGKSIEIDNKDEKYSLTNKLKAFNRDINIINIPKHYLSNSPTLRNNVLNLLEKLNKVTNDKNKNNKSNVTFKQTKINNPIKEEDEYNINLNNCNTETRHNIKPITTQTQNEQQLKAKPIITPTKPICNSVSESTETIPSKINTTTTSPTKQIPYLYIKKKSNQSKQQPLKHNNLHNNNIIEISNNKNSRNNFTNIEISPIKSNDDHVIKQQIPFKKTTITNITTIDKYKVNNKLKSRLQIKTNDDLDCQYEKINNKKGKTHKKVNTSNIEETTLHFGTIDSELQISCYKFKESFSLVDKDYIEFEKGINEYSNKKKLYKKLYIRNKRNSFQNKDTINNTTSLHDKAVEEDQVKNNQFIYKRKTKKDHDCSFSSYKKKIICKSPIVSKNKRNMIYYKKETPKTEKIVKKSSRIREKLINFNKPVYSNNKHNKETEEENNINEDSKDMIELLEDMKFENIIDEFKERKSKHNVTYSACLYKSDFNFLQDEIITNSLNTSNNNLQQNSDENIQHNKELRYSEDLSTKFNQIQLKSKSPKPKDNSYKKCKIKVRHRNAVKTNDKTINSTYPGKNNVNKKHSNLKQSLQCKHKPFNSHVVNTVTSKSLDKNNAVIIKEEPIKSKDEIPSDQEKNVLNLDNKMESKIKRERDEIQLEINSKNKMGENGMNDELKDKQNEMIDNNNIDNSNKYQNIENKDINKSSNINDKESVMKLNKNNNDNKNLQKLKNPIDTKIPLDIIEEIGEATESAEDTSRMINERRKELYIQNRFAKLNKNIVKNDKNFDSNNQKRIDDYNKETKFKQTMTHKEETNKLSNNDNNLLKNNQKEINATDKGTPKNENKNSIEQITANQFPTFSKDQKRERANSRIDFDILQLSPIYKPSRNTKLELTSNNTLHVSSKTNISNHYENELLNYLSSKQQHKHKEFLKFKNKHQTDGNTQSFKQNNTTKENNTTVYVKTSSQLNQINNNGDIVCYQTKKPKRNLNNENTQINSFQKATPIKTTSLNNSIATTQKKLILTPSSSSNYIQSSFKKAVLKPPTIRKPTTKPSLKIQLIQPNIPKIKPAITFRNKAPTTFNQDISSSLDKSIDLLSNPTSYLNKTCNDLLTDKNLTQGLNTSRKQDDSLINIEQSPMKTETHYQFPRANQTQKPINYNNINQTNKYDKTNITSNELINTKLKIQNGTKITQTINYNSNNNECILF